MIENTIPTSKVAAIEKLSRKYLWWKAIVVEGHSVDRMVAQVMRFGTYDDIRKLEFMVEPQVLAGVMKGSAPGWFDDRSWDFWRGRLSASGIKGVQKRRPSRTFAHAYLL